MIKRKFVDGNKHQHCDTNDNNFGRQLPAGIRTHKNLLVKFTDQLGSLSNLELIYEYRHLKSRTQASEITIFNKGTKDVTEYAVNIESLHESLVPPIVKVESIALTGNKQKFE